MIMVGREQTREMFYHAYHNYMDLAFPEDELDPIACKGKKVISGC